MKLLTAQQLREAEIYTIQKHKIPSYDLMEKAATRIVEKLQSWFSVQTPFVVLCGQGNNGGDGLAIARLLEDKGFSVTTFLIHAEKYAKNTQKNRTRLGEEQVYLFENVGDFPPFSENTIVIDALLGSGLNRPIEGNLAEIIKYFNSLPHFKIAIDIPSGLHAEGAWIPHFENTFRADATLTIEQVKKAFLWAENFPFVGDFYPISIDLDKSFKSQQSSADFLITDSFIQEIWQSRSKFAHKGTFGHALTLVGSKGMAGAGILATKAVLKSGAGLVTSCTPACNYSIMQTAFPEAMVICDDEQEFLSQLPKGIENYRAIGMGCGIGTEKPTQAVLKLLLQETVCPLVLDADALNILAENKTWLSYLPTETILTPHPGEFDRLTQKHTSSKERVEAQRSFSMKYHVYCVLKGAHTSISTPDGRLFYNTTGNNGMATAGSGDVLAGIITGLIAQGYSSLKAAIIGVYLHGLAGDFAAEEHSKQAMTASDILNAIGKAFKEIELSYHAS